MYLFLHIPESDVVRSSLDGLGGKSGMPAFTVCEKRKM